MPGDVTRRSRSLSPGGDASAFAARLPAAWQHRVELVAAGEVTAYRVFDGAGDGLPGVTLESLRSLRRAQRRRGRGVGGGGRGRGGCGDARPAWCLGRHRGVRRKRFARMASSSGRPGARMKRGRLSREPERRCRRRWSSPNTASTSRFAYDGLSTGLFLEHRDHRRALAELHPGRVLNLFAYTCAFAMPLARAGAHVTNVDVSSRYLDWGRRNLALNGLPPAAMRFLRRDAVATWRPRPASPRSASTWSSSIRRPSPPPIAGAASRPGGRSITTRRWCGRRRGSWPRAAWCSRRSTPASWPRRASSNGWCRPRSAMSRCGGRCRRGRSTSPRRIGSRRCCLRRRRAELDRVLQRRRPVGPIGMGGARHTVHCPVPNRVTPTTTCSRYIGASSTP